MFSLSDQNIYRNNESEELGNNNLNEDMVFRMELNYEENVNKFDIKIFYQKKAISYHLENLKLGILT